MKKLFFLLLLSLYIFSLLSTKPISIDRIFYFFILTLLIYISLKIIDEIRSSQHIIKEKISSLQLKSRFKKSINFYTFPLSVEASLRDKYPLLDKKQRKEVLKYLRLFLIEKLSNISSDTPSIVLNRTWKAFSLSDEYKSFSSKFFNKDFLPYKPILRNSSGVIELTNTEMDFLNIWKSQCHIEGIDPVFPQRVPTMFMLDETLKIEDGIRFQIDETDLRELISMEDALSPNQLMYSLETLGSHNFLVRLLKDYLENEDYCKYYEDKNLEELLKMIQKNKFLSRIVFGKYTDINFSIEKPHSSSNIYSACGACSGASV